MKLERGCYQVYAVFFVLKGGHIMYTDGFLHTLQISVEILEEFVSHFWHDVSVD